MSAAITWTESTDALERPSKLGVDRTGSQYTVQRHGEGRSHWDAILPNGAEVRHTRASDAVDNCERYAENTAPGPSSAEPDFELDEPEYEDDWGSDVDASGEPDEPPATASGATDTAAAAFSSETTDEQLRETLAALALLLDGAEPAPRSGGYYTSSGQKQDAAMKTIRGLARLRRLVEETIVEQMPIARKNTASEWNSNGATWDQIGAALGVSKQSASTRYGVKKT